MFVVRALAGEVKGAGVAWSGEEEAEGGPNSSLQLLQGELQRRPS